jgi:type II secretory pathway pseudopilin PulG
MGLQRAKTRAFSLLEVVFAFTLLGITLAGLVPLVVMQSRYVSRLEERLDPDAVHHLVPAADSWARRIGVPAQCTTSESKTPIYPSSGHINFQDSGTAAGTFQGNSYRADVGLPFGPAGNSYWYGWSGNNTASTRNRNRSSSPDERYDTLAHMQKYGSFSWEVSVPNGLYQLRLVAGDADFFDSVFVITAEDVPVLAGVPTVATRWVQGTGVVLVLDGKLTVRNGVGASNNKICFIDYAMVTPPNAMEIRSFSHSLRTDEVSILLDVWRKP